MRTPLVLLILSMATIAAVWRWLSVPAAPTTPAIDAASKLDCISYAPFRQHQTPWYSAEIISPQQIAEDLTTLSALFGCIRIYSVENGLDKVPELAARVGLKVMLGVWIGTDRRKNAALIDTAVLLARDFPQTISALMVGSEVLLRGEMTGADLRKIIRSAKARVDIPVSYGDVPEFWLRNPDVADEVDFLTVHVLPYWEDGPVRAEDAAAYVADVHRRIAVAFPGKEILIGEVGWPSRGRMRGSALPGRINQARFISELVALATRENFRVNLFEAYDEPWKRQWEGTAGGHWGLLDGRSRNLKYPLGTPVGDYPFWKLQLMAGLAYAAGVFAAAALTLRCARKNGEWKAWAAVAMSATVGGCLLGLSAENALYEGYSFGGLLLRGLLFAASMVAPPLCAVAVMSGRRLPAFVELIGPREIRTRVPLVLILGGMMMVITLLATETALGLVFDPRGRDFPYGDLTMAMVAIWTVRLLHPPRSATCRSAEAAFAGLLLAAAFYVAFHEGLQNWQAVWTSSAWIALGAALWLPARHFRDRAVEYQDKSMAAVPMARPKPTPPPRV